MRNRFSWRAFISFGLTYSFAILLVTGVILYIAPPGRYANWVNWKIARFSKEEWQALHTVFSLTFAVLSVLHLFVINWRTFLSYLKTKREGAFSKKREFALSTILTLFFLAGIIYSVSPFSLITEWGEQAKASWEKAEEAAPVPHAELLTLNQVTAELKLTSVEEITAKLSNHQIKFENTEQTLADIASQNETTPAEIYSIISKKQASERQGSGIGRKTLEQFANDAGISAEEAMRILSEKGIKAEKGQTLREIGEQNNLPPRDIFELFSNGKKSAILGE